jgi:DNA polymerase-4
MNPTRNLWMEMSICQAEPLTMFVDMNSCFATMEQQANPLLRGRPVGVAAYAAPYGCVIAPSIEAKLAGVKTGMRVWEAQKLCPDIAIIQSNPPLYRDAHVRFKRIFTSYTDKVTPKSIDEAVLDFRQSDATRLLSLQEIGMEIKKRVHDEIGSWVRVNVGIATNRFLAKTAASMNKPDGLTTITKDNLLDVYSKMELLDITGINKRYKVRLNLDGDIHTPLEFFHAPPWKLRKQVFKSIVGHYWHLKMRGWEIEDYDTERKSVGHTYTLQERTADGDMLAKLMMKLCEKTGRRLRRNKFVAEGIHVWVQYADHDFWHQGMRTHARLYTTNDIFFYAMWLLNLQVEKKVVGKMGVTVYDLLPYEPEQLSFFDGLRGDKNELSRSLDAINDRYGELVVGSALLSNMEALILDRISFGGVKDVYDLYDDD